MSLSKQLVSAPAPAPAKFLYSSDLTLIAIVISSVTDVVKLLSYKQLSLPRVCQLVQQLIKNHNKVPISLVGWVQVIICRKYHDETECCHLRRLKDGVKRQFLLKIRIKRTNSSAAVSI